MTRISPMEPSKDHRNCDQELMEQVLFLSSAIDGVADPFIVIGVDFRIRLMNRAAQSFFKAQYAPGEHPLCHQVLFNSDIPCGRAGRICPLDEVLESNDGLMVEYEHVMSGNEPRYFEIHASPLFDEQNTLVGIIESFRDITERKTYAEMLQDGQTELEMFVEERTGELKQAKEQAELLYRVIPSAIFTVDTSRRITTWNKKAENVTGYRAEEVLGKTCDIFAMEPCLRGCSIFSEQTAKPIMGRECTIKTSNGDIRIISKNADLLLDPHGKVIGGVESFEDITGRKNTEKQLRAERDKLSSMLSALNQGMHILNSNYNIEYQNDVLRDLFGDKIGQKCYQVYKEQDEPCSTCRMRDAIATNTVQRTELLMANGRYYEQSYAPFTDVDSSPKVLIMLRDNTDEKAHQAETMRAGQLASIGELAAGVAHEINNPINGIINYAQILLDDSDESSSQGEILSMLIKEGERIADIVRNLLSFARQHGEEIANISLRIVIDEALELIRHQLIKDGITITMELPDDMPLVRANPQQLQQVFLNLLSNARPALNQRFKGKDPNKKVFVTGNIINLEGKTFVRARVTDYGIGISHQIIDKIFDPFFSSKNPGEGTGLGLSISHGLITDFNGYLRVDSKENSFTTMSVDLPALPPGATDNSEQD